MLALGLLLGIPVAELAGFLPTPWFWLSQIATPWMLASFCCGYVCRRPLAAAVSGVSVLALGVSCQVAYKVVVYGGFSVRPVLEVIGYWAILAVCLGSVMGLSGNLSRSEPGWIRTYARSLPAAVVGVEALAIAFGWRSYGWAMTIAIALCAGLLFWLSMLRSDAGRIAVATLTLVVGGLLVLLAVQRAFPMI